MKCVICGRGIEEEYFQANIDKNFKETENGDIVCSLKCAEMYEDRMGGKIIFHYSRITGYYQNVDGWNKGKVKELYERRRYKLSEV